MTTVISSSSNDKYDKDDNNDKVIIFKRVKRDSCGYILPNKYEDVFYRQVIGPDGKPCFERVYLNNKNKNKSKTKTN